MFIVFFFAAICLILGILFLSNKDFLKNLEKNLNKPVIQTIGIADKYSNLLGVFLIILSCVFFAVFFIVKNR